MPIIIVTLGFITLLWGIYSPSSRIRAKHTLVSKYSTVNIMLFLFICLWKEKRKVILKYNLNYILCFSVIFSSIHSSNASSSDTVSVKLSLPNLSQQEYMVERYLNFNYSTYNLLQLFFLSAGRYNLLSLYSGYLIQYLSHHSSVDVSWIIQSS